MKTVPLATFNELEPAELLKERLQMAGIPAIIHDESKLERFGFMSMPLAAVHIEVPQPRYLDARQLLEVWDTADGALHSAVRCPDCNSSRLEFPQLTRKFVTPALMRIFMTLRLMPKEYYCLDCQHTWPTQMPVRRNFDLLNFPTDSRIWPGEKAHHHAPHTPHA